MVNGVKLRFLISFSSKKSKKIVYRHFKFKLEQNSKFKPINRYIIIPNDLS